jgi:hemoglobin
MRFGAIVGEFYRRVMADPSPAPFFAHVDIAALREHQAAFPIQVLGDPSQYHGRDRKTAHAGLPNSEEGLLRGGRTISSITQP